MNYLAHGAHFTDHPYFLAGTAIPDWLSVADRKVRMRERNVKPLVDDSNSIPDQVARGVLQHLEDDHIFHQTRAFHETTGQMTRLFKTVLGTDDGFRPSFLGHVVSELILDAVLIEKFPKLLDNYYTALETVDPAAIQSAVNNMSRNTTERLSPLIPLFLKERFLIDYLTPEGMLYRLNQVMRRIKLNTVPNSATEVITQGHQLILDQFDNLVPPRWHETSLDHHN